MIRKAQQGRQNKKKTETVNIFKLIGRDSKTSVVLHIGAMMISFSTTKQTRNKQVHRKSLSKRLPPSRPHPSNARKTLARSQRGVEVYLERRPE